MNTGLKPQSFFYMDKQAHKRKLDLDSRFSHILEAYISFK